MNNHIAATQQPGHFDILKHLAAVEGNTNLKMFVGDSNFKRANMGKDGWGEFVMAVDNRTIQKLGSTAMMVCLIVVDDADYQRVREELETAVNAHEQLVEALRTLYWSSLVFVGVAPEHMAYEEDDPSYQRERAKVISAIARAEAALELAQKGL